MIFKCLNEAVNHYIHVDIPPQQVISHIGRGRKPSSAPYLDSSLSLDAVSVLERRLLRVNAHPLAL